MIVTQEQVDQYVAETLQPLADELLEYAKGKNIHAPDFYLSCLSITKHALDKFGGRKSKILAEALRDIGSEWATEEVRQRMEDCDNCKHSGKNIAEYPCNICDECSDKWEAK